VIIGGRSAGVAGEITDSPAALMTILLMLVHTFSMNAVASIDYWLNLLEKEIKDIVVSKHSTHLTEVERLLKGNILHPLFLYITRASTTCLLTNRGRLSRT